MPQAQQDSPAYLELRVSCMHAHTWTIPSIFYPSVEFEMQLVRNLCRSTRPFDVRVGEHLIGRNIRLLRTAPRGTHCFGTSAWRKLPNTSQERTKSTPPGNPEYPKFSFEALGVSRNMKIALIVVLTIFGSIETWFWCRAIWQWWKGDQGQET